ncbi:MAG TPA: DnaJ domain-containing protein [Polyangia bacterium]
MSARAHQPRTVVDLYARLGVERTAALPELRRAFRVLALRHHPDRAGVASTEVFQSIAEAYATLCDPVARARYDERLAAMSPQPVGAPVSSGPASPIQGGEFEGPGGRIGWRRQRSRPEPAAALPIARLSGTLEALLASGIARRLADGVVELCLLAHEVAEGGLAAIDAAVRVACPTCAGIAEAGVLWCRRCEFAGTVIDQVTFTVVVPQAARDGLTFSFETDPSHRHPPLRIRLRHQIALARGNV